MENKMNFIESVIENFGNLNITTYDVEILLGTYNKSYNAGMIKAILDNGLNVVGSLVIEEVTDCGVIISNEGIEENCAIIPFDALSDNVLSVVASLLIVCLIKTE